MFLLKKQFKREEGGERFRKMGWVGFELMGGNKTLELLKSIKIRICVIYIM